MVKKKLYATLRGMQYRITPPTMAEIKDLCPLKMTLRREPRNAHDENAIAVYCLERPWKDAHFGYIDRVVASELAPRMDGEEIQILEAWLDEIDEHGIGPVRVIFTKQARPKVQK